MELALMTASTVAGFAQQGWWFIPLIGLVLTIIGMDKNILFARRNADVGAARVFALGTAMTLVNNIAFAAFTFLAGRAFGWLVLG